MHLSDHDLRQFDDTYLDTLSAAQARTLLGKALADLKAARERLGQNPSNSSRPPSTRLPWEGRGRGDTPDGDPDVPSASADPAAAADAPGGAEESEESPAPRPRRWQMPASMRRDQAGRLDRIHDTGDR